MEREIAQLKEDNQRVKSEIMALSSKDRVAKIAEEHGLKQRDDNVSNIIIRADR